MESRKEGEGLRTVRQTIIETVSAPRLMGITTKDFVSFKEAREVYERRVKEKNRDTDVCVQMTTYRDSIPKAILQVFAIGNWVPVDKVEAITEDMLEKCIKSHAVIDPKDYDLALIEQKIEHLKLERPEKGETIRDQVWDLVHSYLNVLEDSGYSEFTSKHSKLAVEHLMKKISHPYLRNRMIITARLKTESEFKKDFNEFVRILADEAARIDHMNVAMRYKPTAGDIAAGLAKKLVETHPPKAGNKYGSKRGKFSVDGAFERKDSMNGKRKRDLPKCLNLECSGNHFIRDCTNSTKEQKAKLVEEYRVKKNLKKKKNSTSGFIGLINGNASTDNTSLFSASFCHGSVEASVLTDSGSDANLISRSMLQKMKKSDPQLKVRKLEEPINFSNARIAAPLIHCEYQICADVMLRVRHGTQLLLRNLKWLVSNEEVGHVFIARHVLSALGLNNRILLEAAADKYRGVVDIPEALAKDGHTDTPVAEPYSENSIHSILRNTSFEHGSTFHGTGVDLALDDTDIYIDLGEDSREDLEIAIQKLVEDAVNNGLSAQGTARLQRMIENFPVFKIRLGKCPPAKVPPMRIRIGANASPVVVKSRRYSPDQRAFLKRYVDQLKEMGFIMDMPTASWQAAPLLVPKSGSAKFRMTVDLRPINAATIKEAWPMPHIDSEVNDFSGSVCFSQLDFVSGYWQLPMHPDSYKLCGIVTPHGVFASTRVLQGLANAVSYFQRTVEPLFTDIRDGMKAWLDDFSLYAKSETQLLDYLEKFLKICHQKGLFLSVKKCRLFLKDLKWCGRIFNRSGYRMDPSRLTGLKSMHVPVTASELGEFIYCCRWMSISLPNFAERVSILNDILEKAYSKSGKRTKKSIKSIQLKDLSWGSSHIQTFRELQCDLEEAITLSYPDTTKTICIFSDASHKFWACVVTQCDSETLRLPFESQKHEPLAFLSSQFRKAELNWSTFEKEGFAIYQAFKKLDYMLYGHPSIHVFTDHRNLLFVFAPLALTPVLGHHIVSKVQRWALVLSTFNYTIEHIRGDENIFADILTRWTRGYRNTTGVNRLLGSILLNNNAQLIPSADSFTWPSMTAIRAAQKNHTIVEDIVLDSVENIWKKGEAIWIPRQCLELQLKIMVTAHCGEGGHRGMDATESSIRESFYWDTIHKDVASLVKTCYHCIITRSGEVIPRPLGRALHGSLPNEVIHIDFLFIGNSYDQKKYVLIIRDDLSSYTWLWAADSPTAEEAAEALAVWIGAFGTFKWLVSDQGSHFKNVLLRNLTSEIRTNHHFTTAYCPWANGSVERICREVLRSFTSLRSEWKLAEKDWPAMTESVQSVLNHAPLKRLGLRNREHQPRVYRTPLEVFTGHIPNRPLLRALPITKYEHAVTTNEAEARKHMKIEGLQDALLGMHREVSESVQKSRQKHIDRHNSKTNIIPASFEKGDFVLVRKPKRSQHKLGFKWKGPKRITRIKSDWVYEVEDLLTHDTEVVHSRRLLLYRADMDDVTVNDDLVKVIEHSEASYQDVKSINDIRRNHEGIHVLIEWEGLPDVSDMTWEPISQVHEDVPDMLNSFLNTNGKRNLKKQFIAKSFKN